MRMDSVYGKLGVSAKRPNQADSDRLVAPPRQVLAQDGTPPPHPRAYINAQTQAIRGQHRMADEIGRRRNMRP